MIQRGAFCRKFGRLRPSNHRPILIRERNGKAHGLANGSQDDYLKFERAADAFARFCHRPITDPPKALIGDAAHHKWLNAAQRSEKNWQKRIGIYLIAAVLAAVAIALALQPLPAIATLLPSAIAGLLIGRTMRQAYNSDEPRIETLIEGASPEQRDRILNLDEFCRRAASGKFRVAMRYPDGSIREFSDDMLKCFVADGGKLLVLSDDTLAWLRIRRRPVPRGQILIDIRGSIASTERTSKSLIDLADETVFDAKFQWLLAHARENSSDANSFRRVLNLIVAFRRPEFAGKTFEQQKEVLEREGHSRSMLEKVHSGNYEPFQRFLRSLPLNEIP